MKKYTLQSGTSKAPPSRRSRPNQPPLPHLNAFGSHCTDESIAFIQEDIETIIVSLQTAPLTDLESLKRVKTLLETLSSFLLSNKSNHSFKFSIDFLPQILSLHKLLGEIEVALAQSPDRPKTSLLYQLQTLTLKNIRNLLKTTNGLKDAAYATLLEALLDQLVAVKERITTTNREVNLDVALQLDSIALTLLKCVFYLASKADFPIAELSKLSLCGKYIGALRCFAFYGLDGYDLSAMTVSLYPSPISQFFSAETSGDNAPKSRRGGGKLDEYELLEDETLFNTSSASFSTSEYSSSELEEEYHRRETVNSKKIYGKMRMLAYEALGCSLPLFGIRHVFGFWSFLFPDTPNQSDSRQWSVLATIARDTSNRVRTSALNYMYNFFNSGKLYIRTLVSESPFTKATSTKAFTPLSVALTSMVKELHAFFETLLLKETNSAVLILVYKVVSLIVAITPYTKIATDLLQPLFHRNSFLLDHKVTQIKNLSLVLFERIFTPEYLQKTFRQWLVESRTGLEVMAKIFKTCFDLIASPDYILLSIESIKLLSSIVKHHSLMVDLLNHNDAPGIDLSTLSRLSMESLESERSLANPVLQSLVAKYIHTLANLYKHVAAKEVAIFGTETDKLEFIKAWYLALFGSRIFQLALVDLDMSLVKGATQVTLVNVISLVPEPVFALMETNTHYHIITILMALARGDFIEGIPPPAPSANQETETEEPGVSIYTISASIRALSLLQAFSCLSDDLTLTFDLIDICLDVLDRNGGRSKATAKKREIYLLEHSLWALANIVDVLKKNRLQAEIETHFLNRIIACLLGCYDLGRIHYHTDDILVNLVRSSGIVLYLALSKPAEAPGDSLSSGALHSPKVDAQMDQPSVLAIVRHMMTFLLTKRLYKLQWNICIALSYLLALDGFVGVCVAQKTPEGAGNLLEELYSSLVHVYALTPNHKVQSYAVYTVASIARLELLRPQLATLWPLVVDKFILHFNSVPVHSQLSWLEKYTVVLRRLVEVYVLPRLAEEEEKLEANQEAKETIEGKLEELRTFVECIAGYEYTEESFALQIAQLRETVERKPVLE